MPTIFTHSLTGFVSAIAVYNTSFPKRFWVLSVLCAILPDADVICFKIGIPYSHFFGHRGFFHSLFFAGMVGFSIGMWGMKTHEIRLKGRLFFAGYFSFLIGIHDLLDAFTNGGLGIALLSPFSLKRYFFWVTPIEVSPINPKVFLSSGAFGILKNEFFWVWMPCICIALLFRFIFGKQIQRFYYS